MNENEFLIELQAKLDEAKSKENINVDINRIQDEIKKLQIQAEISPENLQKIITKVKNIFGKGMKVSNINLDSKGISQNAQNAAKNASNAFKSNFSLDGFIDKQVKELMDELGISGKNAFNNIKIAISDFRKEMGSTTDEAESFEDILNLFANDSNSISKLTSSILANKKAASESKAVYADLVEYIKQINKDGNKIHLPSSIKAEYGEMFNSMKSSLGSAFTTKGGTDFEVFVTELNEELGKTIDLSKGVEYAFGDLVKKVKIGRGKNSLSGNDLFDETAASQKEAESIVKGYIDKIESEYQKISQASNQSANTIVQDEERKRKAYQETNKEYEKIANNSSLIRDDSGFRKVFEVDNKSIIEAREHFAGLLADENAIITTTEKFDDSNSLNAFTVNIKRATGEVETLRYALENLAADGEKDNFKLTYQGGSINDAGAKKQLQNIENAFSDYTAKIAQFKNTNKEILTGLSAPIGDFESKLAGLKNGSSTIDDVRNSFKLLNAEASNITSNFTGQLNKIDAAVRNIAKGEETISGLRAEFKGLDNIPKNIDSELQKVSDALINIKKIESEEGRTANWAEAYREWEIVVDNLKAKLIALKKEQSNAASTQVYKTSDLRKNDIAYMTNVSNTINKQMAEIEKMAHAKGWTDFDVTGIEEADGKIKALVMTVTDAEGAIKKLNFQRAKLVGNGKVQDGLMQTGDVQILKTAAKAQEELAVKTQKTNAEFDKQTTRINPFQMETMIRN